MTQVFLRTILLAAAMCLAPPVAAQDTDTQTPVTLVGTEQHTLSSDILGEDIIVAVSLPFGYGQGVDTRYPLLIALDGNVMFGMASEVPRLMSFEGTAPPMLVATVLYKDMQHWLSGRMRDFHSKDNGAATFLKALKQEIIPLIETRYRTKRGERTLYGHSSGGLFAVYAAIEEPTLFTRVLASSPSLEEEPVWSRQLLKQLKSNDHIPKIYMSVDTSETAMQAAVQPFADHLVKQAGSMYRYDTLDQGGHMAVIPAAYAQGLRWLF